MKIVEDNRILADHVIYLAEENKRLKGSLKESERKRSRTALKLALAVGFGALTLGSWKKKDDLQWFLMLKNNFLERVQDSGKDLDIKELKNILNRCHDLEEEIMSQNSIIRLFKTSDNILRKVSILSSDMETLLR